MGFVKPPRGRASVPSPHLFVANCGPALGLDLLSIQHFFQTTFGPLACPVRQADATGTRVIVSFCEPAHAVAALTALHAVPCPSLLNRTLHIQFAHQQHSRQVKEPSLVFRNAADIGIPGLYLFENFTSDEEEQELLAAVDERMWHSLAKRRVQHYGYEFQYKTRNVDVSQKLGELPGFTQLVVQRISELSQVATSSEISLPLDQLTVNEYPAGVGLSPHIDTHSAFVGAIISLSLAGPCVMEFRKYDPLLGEDSTHDERNTMSFGESGLMDVENQHDVGLRGKKSRCPLECRSLLLPERSLLVLLDEARYRWHHYIPHHKADHVLGETIQRCRRRVSFTFRKVRHGPCRCRFESCCDSQTISS